MVTLDAEIRRINRMRIPAAERSDMVRRAQRIAACLREPSAPPLDDVWCSRCGFLLEDHDRLERRLSDRTGG